MLIRFLLYWIQHMNQNQVDQILDAAVARRQALFPNWDMIYLALPKDDMEEREKTIAYALRHLQ